MPRGDRAERRRTNEEHDARMRQLQEQWLSGVQQRQHRGADSNLDRGIKASTHGMTMMERMQRMQVERVRLSMEVAQHKMKIAEMQLNLGIKGEQLINMRRARSEFHSQMQTLKKKLWQAKKYAEKMNRWSEAMEDLIWGSLISPRNLSTAWRGFFCLMKEVDRSVQREIAVIPITNEEKGKENLAKPGETEYNLGGPLESNTLVEMFKHCQKNKLIPREGSKLQEGLFKVMQMIDESLAMMGAEHETNVEKHSQELKELSTAIQKRHNVL